MGSRRKPIPAEIAARLNKFFLSNLPDQCSGAVLAKEVRNFGNIFDIYVARKGDKDGRRFAFVSLIDVKDHGEMEKVLSSIRLGEYKLKVNVARFVLEEGEVNARKPVFHPKKEGSFKQKMDDVGSRLHASHNTFNTNAMSFKEAISGESRGKTIVLDDSVNAVEDMHGRSLVVRVCSLDVLKKIKWLLNDMKLGEGEVRCLGGFVVLISFKTSEHAVMVKDELVGRTNLFSSVDLLEGKVSSYERIAWLKVSGIPMCVLDDHTLENIGGFFGSIVRKPLVERIEIDSTFQYIGVLVGHGARIQEVLFLKWRGKTFKVWIEEDDKNWISDFIDEVGDVDSDMEEDDQKEDP
ncbi:putative RNA recognition motif domain, nucleotide-binding alpha-beta plait domain superfamily [Helianthus annuus]|nr:putative RNA recognition motif domain, nucleotide-binding alpha-beta plait domain superfamily [Helianthus annuus]